MTATPDALATAEQALGIVALHGDECAAALLAELERLRAIEAAARALEAASRYSRVYPASQLIALRELLEKGGAK